jgi:hypothetical protein
MSHRGAGADNGECSRAKAIPNAFVRAASLCYLCYQPKALDRQWRMWPKLTSVATVILVHQKTPIPRASVAPFPTLFIE